MEYPSLSEVRSLVEQANVSRWRGDASGGDELSDTRPPSGGSTISLGPATR